MSSVNCLFQYPLAWTEDRCGVDGVVDTAAEGGVPRSRRQSVLIEYMQGLEAVGGEVLRWVSLGAFGLLLRFHAPMERAAGSVARTQILQRGEGAPGWGGRVQADSISCLPVGNRIPKKKLPGRLLSSRSAIGALDISGSQTDSAWMHEWGAGRRRRWMRNQPEAG